MRRLFVWGVPCASLIFEDYWKHTEDSWEMSICTAGFIDVDHDGRLIFFSVGRSYRASSSWGWWMLQIGTPLMMTTGLVGNLLSFIVLKSTRFRGKSYSHYLCTLAIFDSLVLVDKFINRIDSLLIDTGRENIFAMFTDVACKVSSFLQFQH